MTSERLITFLENPAEMGNVTYQEMKTLTLNYPFSSSLRVLLLLKSVQEKHWEKGHNLAMASVYAPDRNRLFCLMSPKMGVVKVSEKISAPIEAVLELKPLATAEQEIAARKAAEVEVEQKTAPAQAKVAELPIFFEKNETVFKENTSAFQPVRIEKILPASTEGLGEKSEHIDAPKSLPPQPKPFVFSEWIGQFNLPVLPKKAARISAKAIDNQPVAAPKAVSIKPEKTDPIVEEKPDPIILKKTESTLDPEKEREAAVKKLVKRSVKEKEEITSETLAKLYARQGYKEKAVAMYRKLMLVFPDKSATFAAEIEKLGR